MKVVTLKHPYNLYEDALDEFSDEEEDEEEEGDSEEKDTSTIEDESVLESDTKSSTPPNDFYGKKTTHLCFIDIYRQ